MKTHYATVPLRQLTSADLSHETAALIHLELIQEALGQPHAARLSGLVDLALGHIDQWFRTQTSSIIPHEVGCTLRALIVEQSHHPDSRIPLAIKQALDGLWSGYWMPDAGAFRYSNGEEGRETDPGYDLTMLLAPAYAWQAAHSSQGEDAQRADMVFAGGVTHPSLPFPKQFDQNYLWSAEYIRWRDPEGLSHCLTH